MRSPLVKRQCRHCMAFFDPNPRSAGRQRYCSKPECRQASKAASQRRWLKQPANRDYFKGSAHVERVRQWRKAHPGYWRRKGTERTKALQDAFMPHPPLNQALDDSLKRNALQDSFFIQPAVLVGLIAHLTGLALQDDIESTARRLQQLGHDILSGSPSHIGGIPDAPTPHIAGETPPRAQPVQLGGSALGP